MKIIPASRTYAFDPTRYFEFERFADNSGDFYLIEGFTDYRILDQYKDHKVIAIELEDPNRFLIDDPNFNHFSWDKYLYKVLSICPYTAEWLNSIGSSNKYQHVFFPFNEKYIPSAHEKKYDVIYTGHIHSRELLEIVRTISRFDYRFVSGHRSEYVTDFNVSYFKKLELIAQTKVMVVNNLLFPTYDQLKTLIKIRHWEKNEAFADVIEKYDTLNDICKSNVYLPQLKSRVFEAAFSKTLILCRRDRWNVIERYFTPGENFVYYEEGNLEQTIKEVLNNWDHFRNVAQKAYKKAIQHYTTEAFFSKFVKDIDINIVLDTNKVGDITRRGTHISHIDIETSNVIHNENYNTSSKMTQTEKAVGIDSKYVDTSAIEKRLEDTYVSMLTDIGTPLLEAKSTVHDMLRQANEESLKEGTANLPANMGDNLLERESVDENISSLLSKKRTENITDGDIRWWWNMDEIERRMILKFDDYCKHIELSKLIKEVGISEEGADRVLRKIHPFFGEPGDANCDDKPLPYELINRIYVYIQNLSQRNGEKYERAIQESSSFNAFIRSELRKGNL